MKKRIAPAPQRLVVTPESHVSHRGFYLVLMSLLLLLSLSATAYLYVRYEGDHRHQQAAADAQRQMQAELTQARQRLSQAQTTQAELTALQQRFEATRVSLAAAQTRTRALEAEAEKWTAPTTVTLPTIGVAITELELLGKGEWRDFRLTLERAHAVDTQPPEDAAVQLRAEPDPALRGTVRLVVAPKQNPDQLIYVPKASWKRENGIDLDLANGRQEIRELFEMPEGGIRDVRVEVLLYHPRSQPNSGYTLIRRVFRTWNEG